MFDLWRSRLTRTMSGSWPRSRTITTLTALIARSPAPHPRNVSERLRQILLRSIITLDNHTFVDCSKPRSPLYGEFTHSQTN